MKPVRMVRRDQRVLLANQVNLVSALRVALLTLPEEFTERELWEKVAGISYSGESGMGFLRLFTPGGSPLHSLR